MRPITRGESAQLLFDAGRQATQLGAYHGRHPVFVVIRSWWFCVFLQKYASLTAGARPKGLVDKTTKIWSSIVTVVLATMRAVKSRAGWTGIPSATHASTGKANRHVDTFRRILNDSFKEDRFTMSRTLRDVSLIKGCCRCRRPQRCSVQPVRHSLLRPHSVDRINAEITLWTAFRKRC